MIISNQRTKVRGSKTNAWKVMSRKAVSAARVSQNDALEKPSAVRLWPSALSEAGVVLVLNVADGQSTQLDVHLGEKYASLRHRSYDSSPHVSIYVCKLCVTTHRPQMVEAEPKLVLEKR